MTKSEDIVRKRYEQLGFIVVHRGAPDFLIFNYDKTHKVMYDINFVEVKPSNAPFLTLEQSIWRCALETLHCKYEIETPIGRGHDRDWYERNFTELNCRHCKQKMVIHKDIILEKLREINKIPKIRNDSIWDMDRMIDDYRNKNNGKTIQ